MQNLDIKVVSGYTVYPNIALTFSAALDLFQGAVGSPIQNITIGTLDPPNSVFPTVQDAIDYYYPSMSAAVVTSVNTLLGSSVYQLGDKIYYDQSVNTAIKTKENIPTHNESVSRSFNSAFQISSTSSSYVNYSVQISTTLSLTAGQTGTVSLQISPTSGGSYTEIGRFVNGNTGTLAIGLNLTQASVGQIQGYVPASYYTKLVTTNTTGTPTFTYLTGQEVLY